MLPALNCDVNIFNTFLNLRPVRDEQVWLFWESFLSYFENIELRLIPCIFYFAVVITEIILYSFFIIIRFLYHTNERCDRDGSLFA